MWRKSLDEGKVVAAILMDLSKAFDAMPHDLLFAKLRAYRMPESALKALRAYFLNHKQRVKISDAYSDWDTIIKGIPQASILGPILFNCFINDLFYFIKHSDLYNYADDNTLCYQHKDVNVLQDILMSDSAIAVKWFKSNYMEDNPDKFQAFVLGSNKIKKFTLSCENGNIEIPCDKAVKLLGVTFDQDFTFDSHEIYLLTS